MNMKYQRVKIELGFVNYLLSLKRKQKRQNLKTQTKKICSVQTIITSILAQCNIMAYLFLCTIKLYKNNLKQRKRRRKGEYGVNYNQRK